MMRFLGQLLVVLACASAGITLNVVGWLTAAQYDDPTTGGAYCAMASLLTLPAGFVGAAIGLYICGKIED